MARGSWLVARSYLSLSPDTLLGMSFRCSDCGYSSGKWMGFCPSCHSENPLVEEVEHRHRRVAAPEAVPLEKVRAGSELRRLIGMAELDRVLGGGLVSGSVILVGGEPGVGKSTLLLQAAASVAAEGGRALVCTGEESAEQVGMRAHRLGIPDDREILLLPDDDLDRIIAAADKNRPDLLVVDSIQSVSSRQVEGAAGGPSQVRESAARLIRFAKERHVTVALVGHVTKDGNLAGPKLLEHMVDVVLSFEGDIDYGLRALRSLKNRFGPTHVVGMFDMQGEGLVEVADPSRAFLAEWRGDVPGTVVFPAVEGRRSILVEVQALADSTRQAQPRRSFRGVDQNRVHQILAVLHRHGRVRVHDTEVYVNVVGGWNLDEPACDLAIALAITSSIHEVPLGSTAAWGEIGLAGEVRPVPNYLRRREEALRLGVDRLIAPETGSRLDLRSALLQAGLW
jgi:DNA repair protein RadA/Sms